MGVLFLEHINGTSLYTCKICNTNLSNKKQLMSTSFSSRGKRAFLFDKIVNVTYGKVKCRKMNTGKYFVRDVHCKNCSTTLGWKYEYAVRSTEQYKEGKFVLKVSVITECKGIEEACA